MSKYRKFSSNHKGRRILRPLLAFMPVLCSILHLNLSAVVLNEVMSADNEAFADDDGSFEDWIELYNPADTPFSITGWSLSDNLEETNKWVFCNAVIQPHDHLLVWASGKDRNPPFNSSGEPLCIIATSSDWSYLNTGGAPPAEWSSFEFDHSSWPVGPGMLGYNCSEVQTTLSYGDDYYNKDIAYYFRQSFNIDISTDEISSTGILNLWVDDGAIVYLNGAEILRVRMPDGAINYQTPATTVTASRGQWETFNVSLESLKQGGNTLAVEVHQANTTSSDLCFWLELNVQPSELHTNFKISSGNEGVYLFNSSGELVDQAPAWSVIRDASIGRISDLPTNSWSIFPLPSPGTTNPSSGFSGILEAPRFSIEPGFYADPVTLLISHADTEADIYYTVDGTTPTNSITDNCFLYSGSLTLTNRCCATNLFSLIPTNPPEMTNHTQYGWMAPASNQIKANVIRATAFREGYCSPRSAAGTWFIGDELMVHSLPVISISADYDNLFGDPEGLFVPGDVYLTEGWNGHYVGKPNANYFQIGDLWERAVMLQMFDVNRNPVLSQMAGLRNHGGWSRAAAQKTLRVYARGEYGDSRLNYNLFPSQEDDSFKRFLIRNSGNDWSSTGLRDLVMQRIFRDAVCTDTQDGTPVVVYINGEYWGKQNIRELYSKHYFKRVYDVDEENLDFVKAMPGTQSMEIMEGDDIEYIDVLDYVKTNNMADAVHYAWMESHMDLDNLIDHYACEIYCCNTDWPGNNLGLWRERNTFNPLADNGRDGRWRWVMYDTDHGFGLSSSETTDMMYQARRSSRGVCQPHFDNLLANSDFRNRFVNRFADLINTAFKPERVVSIIEAAALKVQTEMPRHIDRWGRMLNTSRWNSNIDRMKSFANNRPAPALENIVSEFSLEGTYNLTLSISNGAGFVQINSLMIDENTLGLSSSAQPYPWSGTYFKTVPVCITAENDPGFDFMHWDVNGSNIYANPLIITPSENMSVTAVFETGTLPEITINEIMADPSIAGLPCHPVTRESLDWFELYNEGVETVDLSGWKLIDDNPDNVCIIPDDVSIAPGECKLVWADANKAVEVYSDGSFNVDFGIGRNGDSLTLLRPDNTIMDTVTFGSQAEGVSIGRWVNGSAGEWMSCNLPTPGLPNCNPAVYQNNVPLFAVRRLEAGSTLNLQFTPNLPVTSPVWSVIDGPDGASIDASGNFSWSAHSNLVSGVYSFRIFCAGIQDGNAISDESTLLVYLSNNEIFNVELVSSPVNGGTTSGAGTYAADQRITLTATAAPAWQFTSWSDGSTAAAREICVQRDISLVANFAYGLAVPSGAAATFTEDGLPLIYWCGTQGAEKFIISRSSSPAGPFSVIGETGSCFFIDENPIEGVSCYYTLCAGAYGTIGPSTTPMEPYQSGASRELFSSVIGTLGSYYNNPDRTRDKVFDHNTDTFYDAASDGGWPGMDTGALSRKHLDFIRYHPRISLPQRMLNGSFQICSVSDTVETFEDPVTLHTVTSIPPINEYQSVSINEDHTFRYFRYLPPSGGWGNIAEAELHGCDSIPPVPTGLIAKTQRDQVTLEWTPVEYANGYFVYSSVDQGVTFALSDYTTSPFFTANGLDAEKNYEFKVAAVNCSSYSACSLSTQITTEPISIASFTNTARGSAVSTHDGVVSLTLSGELDSRLQLVCSDNLQKPVSEWQPVANPAFSAPDIGTGHVQVTIPTNAPSLFFCVRLRN